MPMRVVLAAIGHDFFHRETEEDYYIRVYQCNVKQKLSRGNVFATFWALSLGIDFAIWGGDCSDRKLLDVSCHGNFTPVR